MLTAPWRRLVTAARWKGQAAQVATGVASASDHHCQPVSCSAGTIASAMTGTERAAATSRRSRSAATSRSVTASSSACGRGSSAAYPACATVSSSTSVPRPVGKTTWAFSVA